MSFLRPRWLDDLVQPRPSASPRLRGLKGFEPHQIVANQDAHYADDPQFWILTGLVAAAPGNFGHIGVQVPADDSLVVTVDAVLVNTPSADDLFIDVTEGGTGTLSLTTDTVVIKRNRKELSRSTGVERVGLLRIFDNAGVGTGTSIASVRTTAAGAAILLPFTFRLFSGDQFFVRNSSANLAVEATLWGRLTAKGAR